MQGEKKEGKLLVFVKKFQTTSISRCRKMKKTKWKFLFIPIYDQIL